MPEVNLKIDSPDVQITVSLPDGSTRVYKVVEELKVSKNDLNQAYIDQPGKYAWWGMVAETARINMEQAKAKMERVEAEADKQVRLDIKSEGEKVTEALVTRRIKTHPSFVQAQEEYLQAKQQFGVLDRVLKAFDQRMDALISLGANVRGERKNTDFHVRHDDY